MNSPALHAAPRRAPLPRPDRIPPLDLTAGRYRLRFAREVGDLEAAQRLRYRVFNVELGEGLPEAHATGLDADAFDGQCEHLLVEVAGTGEVVGTYRMQTAASARAGAGWYSDGEFDLGTLPAAWTDGAVELGRACIDAAHRDRSVLLLLFRGLIGYLEHHGADRFFGCSSLTGTDARDGAALYRRLLRDGHVDPERRVHPRAGLACPVLALAGEERTVEVPKLFGIYLRHGARVLGPPAIDREFGTIDFLTALDCSPEFFARFRGRS